jgi:hypothetical protein
MLKICSWCESIIGWHYKSKGESHGICPDCVLEYFPQEADLLFSTSRSAETNMPGLGAPIGSIVRHRPMEDSFIKLLPAGLFAARQNVHISGDARYGNH